MAQYRFLQDCYVNGFYFNAGDVASLPGWQPSGAVDPIDNAAITAFFNAGPQRLVGPIRPRWSGQVVSPPAIYWVPIDLQHGSYQLTGAGAALGVACAGGPLGGLP